MSEFQMPSITSKPELKDPKPYIRRLNKLASAGFNTPLKLRILPTKIIAHIKNLYPGDDASSRSARRYFICAIYYVLPLSYRQGNNPYRALYLESTPLIEGGWLTKSEFLATT